MAILEIDWRCLLEILILFLIVYSVLYYLRNTRGSMVMLGLLIGLNVLWPVADSFGLKIIRHMFEQLSGYLLLMLLIIFQPELRRALAQLGTLASTGRRRQKELVGEIVSATEDMARRKCGALIVIERKIRLQALIDDSISLNAKVNSLLLESIFYPNSALHDGAVIIREDRIVAARVILPLTRAENISRRLGTRHRAALGISEESDAVTVMVSEETGAISIAFRGVLHRDLSPAWLQELLLKLVMQNDESEFEETMRKISASQDAEAHTEQVPDAEDTGKNRQEPEEKA